MRGHRRVTRCVRRPSGRPFVVPRVVPTLAPLERTFMDIFSFPPIAAILDAGYTGLIALSTLFEPLAGATAAALAVIVVTLIVRAALIPVGVSQAKGEQIRSRLAPKLQAIQKKYGKNPEKMQRETLKLYEAEKTSPLAGCLPMLIQAPIVGLIYTLFIHPQIAGHPNTLLTEQLAGVPLGSSFAHLVVTGTLTLSSAVVFLIVAGCIALVGELTRRAFRPTQPIEGPLGGAGAQRLLGAMQFLTAIISLFVPLAAGLYLTVTVAWTLVQRVVLRRRYPLIEPAAVRQEGAPQPERD